MKTSGDVWRVAGDEKGTAPVVSLLLLLLLLIVDDCLNVGTRYFEYAGSNVHGVPPLAGF
ncbi:MAG TPA: hypothetical protein VFR76_05140 [Verrucomicrobiae bacterium]|nr:hypothetical protein [Verrucomicrobiae bacterium]